MVVDERRHAVAGRFGEPHIARNYVLEDEIPEAITDIVRDLVGQTVAAIEHGERNSDDTQVRIETLLDPFDRLQKLAQPLQRKEFALQGH